MGERYEKSIAKENSEISLLLGGTATPQQVVSEKAKADDDNNDEKDGEQDTANKQKKKRKQKKKSVPETKPVTLDEAVLEAEDEVQEGVDWSSGEED